MGYDLLRSIYYTFLARFALEIYPEQHQPLRRQTYWHSWLSFDNEPLQSFLARLIFELKLLDSSNISQENLRSRLLEAKP